MKIIKPLIIAVSLFASCTLFYNSSNNTRKVDTDTRRPVRVLVEEQQQYPVKKTYDSKVWNDFGEKGASSVKNYKELHDKSIDENGYGIFYGSESKYAYYTNWDDVTSYQLILIEQLLADDDPINFCKDRGLNDFNEAFWRVSGEETPSDFKQPMRTDCLEWCVLNLRKAYEKAGMAKEWKMVERTALERSMKTPTSKFLKKDGVTGVELAKKLVEDGWTCMYYNPDINLPGDKPAYIPEEPWDKKSLDYKIWWRRHMLWTEHPTSYDNVKKYGNYYGIPVTGLLVDYRPTTKLTDEYAMVSGWMENEDLGKGEEYYKAHVISPTLKKTDKVEQLKKVPFGFLLTRGGNHCALISYGKVYEVHRASSPIKKNLIDVKDFETEWDWLSGVILVPPGAWQK